MFNLIQNIQYGTGYYFGYDMAAAPVPNIKITSASLGIDKHTVSVGPEVLVYPNPSAGQFTVQFNGYKSQKANVVITNMMGQIVAQKEVKLMNEKQNIAFNIPNPTQGVFLLKLTSEEGVKTLKIVIEK